MVFDFSGPQRQDYQKHQEADGQQAAEGIENACFGRLKIQVSLENAIETLLETLLLA